MAEPITWRNVTGPTPAEAAQPMRFASADLNAGFAALQKTLGMVTDNQDANWQNQKVNNTQALMDALRGAKSPEEMAALQQSGALAEMKAGFGAQFDRNAVNAAEDARPGILRDNLTKEQQFGVQQDVVAHQPLADQAKAAYLRGDTAAGDQILANFPSMPQANEIAAFKRDLTRQNTSDQRINTEFDWKTADRPLMVDKLKGEIANSAANVDISRGQLGVAQTRADAEKLHYQAQSDEKAAALRKAQNDKLELGKKEAYKQLLENSGMASGTLDTEAGKEALMKGLKARGIDEKQQSDILYNLNKYFRDGGIEVGTDKDGKPIKMPISVTDALKAVEQSTDNPLAIGFSRRGDDFANILQNRFGHKSAVTGQDNTSNQDKQRIEEVKAVLRATTDRLSPLSSSFAGPALTEAQKKSSEISNVPSGTPTAPISGTQQERVSAFMKQVGPQAERVAQQLGVPVDAVIGQWGLETGWGKSVIPGTNNFGNIKDFSKNGNGVAAKDNMNGSVDKYRKYNDADGFANDFSTLLGNRRYAGALNTQDAQAYFSGLKAGGYAEDPNYVQSGTRAANMVSMARRNSLPANPSVEGGRGTVNPTLDQVAPALSRPGDDAATVKETSFVSISGSSAPSKSNSPVEIPKDVNWSPPVTAVQAAKPGGQRAMVTYVGDGDGANLTTKDGNKLNCRIDSIDAPEVAHMQYGKPSQNFGEQSKKILKDMIENKEVTVRVTRAPSSSEGKDSRSYCQIEVEGVGVDQKMLEKGAAWLYRRYSNDPKLAEAEAGAKAKKVGIWEDPNAQYPEDFRRQNPGTSR
jgi:endonuclease YncB( thermonuclease family)/flagellum-specific peptidoglycan hydrolase FlgJ